MQHRCVGWFFFVYICVCGEDANLSIRNTQINPFVFALVCVSVCGILMDFLLCKHNICYFSSSFFFYVFSFSFLFALDLNE